MYRTLTAVLVDVLPVQLLSYTDFKKYKKRAVYRASFLTWDYETKFQKSKKKTAREIQNYKVSHIHARTMVPETVKIVKLEHELP